MEISFEFIISPHWVSVSFALPQHLWIGFHTGRWCRVVIILRPYNWQTVFNLLLKMYQRRMMIIIIIWIIIPATGILFAENPKTLFVILCDSLQGHSIIPVFLYFHFNYFFFLVSYLLAMQQQSPGPNSKPSVLLPLHSKTSASCLDPHVPLIASSRPFPLSH